jgi:nitrous oxide reductase accessory protein NosL
MRALVIAVILVLGCGRDEAPAPVEDEAEPVAEAVPDEHRCPVCAMDPSEHPKNAATIELTDGRVFHFCGTGCMLRTWLHPEVFLGVERDLLKKAVVQEYFEGRPLDAAAAVWVAGSDVVGPMGPALVPLASEEDAAVFRERHGGTHTFHTADLDDALWLEIKGKPAAPPTP